MAGEREWRNSPVTHPFSERKGPRDTEEGYGRERVFRERIPLDSDLFRLIEIPRGWLTKRRRSAFILPDLF